MAGPGNMLSASANQTPTQKSFTPQPSSNNLVAKTSLDRERDGLQIPLSAAAPAGGPGSMRNLAASAVSFAPRGTPMNPSPAPGSFSSDLRSQMGPPRAGSRADAYMEKVDEHDSITESTLHNLRDQLNREMKIRDGSENMLDALNSKKAKQTKDQRARVEAELNASNQRIRELKQCIFDAQRARVAPTTPTRPRADTGGHSNNGVRSPPSASRSGAGSEVDESAESPTFVLAEILQALEVEGMPPEYYVARGNSFVDLFKRHPTLKYPLRWSIFGLRMQILLLSDSREVAAAGYRMIRYAISDRSSLKQVRRLNTDYLVVLSLIKDRKADVEREQALKFVRAFLDVKEGVKELSRAIVRTVAAVAETAEDRLRPICLETLAEILVRDPQLLMASGGLAPLSEALAEGSYKAPESLTSAILYLLDAPQRRKYLRAGYELEVLFTAFTDHFFSTESILKQNTKAVASAFKTWPGLMNLAMYDFRAVRSLVDSLVLPAVTIKETVLDLIYTLLRIKSPAWASSYLAGRRLTTYGRVTTLKAAAPKVGTPHMEDDGGEQNFVEHFTALLLAMFIKSGLLSSLLQLAQDPDNEHPALKRKSTLLIGEVLRLSSRLLPPAWSSELQLLPELFRSAARLKEERHFIATGIVYQISSVSRTLYRSAPSTWTSGGGPATQTLELSVLDEQPRANAAVNMDETSFRTLLLDSGVLSSSNYNKWNWDVMLRIIEGPLTVPKRLEEAVRASKFVKRIVSFYRPFKFKFSEIKPNRNSQKYVRVGCALFHSLLQTTQGVQYLTDSKLLRQIAECLAQCDPGSGLTAQYPLFSREHLNDTLCQGYFAMLGVLSSDARGLHMMDRWRMFNMIYHIMELKQRPDLIKLLLTNFDYTPIGHPRVLLSKALTAGTKDVRIHATNVLRKYAVVVGSPFSLGVGDSKWAIQFLVTQLYDPEVEVCATAVKILEKACNHKSSLEFIVECRPALDHLGEIGAPLLLRFLSTSIGYHYLDGLDYISNEMDDWFLGRNDSYVNLIEASLARAFVENPEDHPNRISVFEDEADVEVDAHIPPHFYRELTRTREGCKLLRDKGHFDEFASTIQEHGMQTEDAELMTKIKGCLWAVGNVGSMELGAPFLEGCDVVDRIVQIAQEHQVMSLRGTAFFVLGLISRSLHGLEILSEHGWDSNTNILGQSMGFCIPTDLSQFFSLVPWTHEKVKSKDLPNSQKTEITEPPPYTRPRSISLLSAMGGGGGGGEISVTPAEQPNNVELDSDPTNQRILELIIDLGNMVISKRAANELMQLKQVQKAPGFRQPQLFRKVMCLLECHHYRLPVRRMVLEMFDRSVLRHIVFDDDDDDDDDDDEEQEDEENEQDGASNRGGGELHSTSSDEDEEAEGAGLEESSGDEQRTERQRSISNPAIPQKDTARNRAG